jgi:hypothetical protein
MEILCIMHFLFSRTEPQDSAAYVHGTLSSGPIFIFNISIFPKKSNCNVWFPVLMLNCFQQSDLTFTCLQLQDVQLGTDYGLDFMTNFVLNSHSGGGVQAGSTRHVGH